MKRRNRVFAFLVVFAVSLAWASPNAMAASDPVLAVIGLDDAPHLVASSPDGSRVYVTQPGGHMVSVIDTASNAVIASIPTGDNSSPNGLAVSPDGSKVYVGNQTAGTVAVIDAASLNVTAAVPVGGNIYGVAVSPTGSEVYVVNSTNGTVAVIDAATNSVIGTVPTGGNGPYGVAVSPDGSKVYVCNTGSGTVAVIDAATNSLTATVNTGGLNPQSLAVSPDGSRVYVVNDGSDTVSVIDTATDSVIALIASGGYYPGFVAVSPDGSKVYVSNGGGSGAVSVIDTATDSVTGTVPTGGIGPLGLAVSPDGSKVYVANWVSFTVSVLDAGLIVAAPTVTSVSPSSGPAEGGTRVTITGTGFQTGATVAIGGTAATDVTVTNSTTIVAATPAGPPGAADVTVTNPDTQTGTGTGLFTYQVSGAFPQLVNVNMSGVPSGGGYASSMSRDGNFVAFTSSASDLVPDDANGTVEDCFVRDRSLGVTTLVSVGEGGVQGNLDCKEPVISADGSVVAFYSNSSNLVSGDTNQDADIFVRDLRDGVTSLVSVDSAGGQFRDTDWQFDMSADGSLVTFVGYEGSTSAVWVRDRRSGTSMRVSPQDIYGNPIGISNDPSISGDGSVVVYVSTHAPGPEGWTYYGWQLLAFDRSTGVTSVVSVDSSGDPGDNGSNDPSVSYDGRYVVFDSGATDLVAGDTNGLHDVFVRDRTAGVTTRVSVAGDAQGDGSSSWPSISDDGRIVVFSSAATNLVSGDTNVRFDVYSFDRETGTLARLSVNSEGVEGDSDSTTGWGQVLSGDGRFESAWVSFLSVSLSGGRREA